MVQVYVLKLVGDAVQTYIHVLVVYTCILVRIYVHKLVLALCTYSGT
jgi:hypothetical protein